MYNRRFSSRPFQVLYARLVPAGNSLAFESSYQAELVQEFKSLIPHECRAWDGAGKRWLVDPRYGQVCADLAQRYLGVMVLVPQVSVTAATETRLLRLEYLGATKVRENGESTASGYADGGWTVIVPEPVLKAWFNAVPQRPDEHRSFYSVLLLKAEATPEKIRSAYRRLARQWHPDVCREPDAAEQFKAIHHAYQVLMDPITRRKYDAGLALEASVQSRQQTRAQAIGYQPWEATYDVDGNQQYRAPLRCGWVMAEGVMALGRFVVAAILAWEDIVQDGKTMVASWPRGADKFEVQWV